MSFTLQYNDQLAPMSLHCITSLQPADGSAVSYSNKELPKIQHMNGSSVKEHRAEKCLGDSSTCAIP